MYLRALDCAQQSSSHEHFKEKAARLRTMIIEALKLDESDCEASLYLGSMYSRQEDWKNASKYCRRAAQCFADRRKGLEAMINETRDSSISGERKQQLISLKEAQLSTVLRNEAAALYEAAVCYSSSGMNKRALDYARRALNCAKKTHSLEHFKEKVDKLIKRLREIEEHHAFCSGDDPARCSQV
jgi:tetratricopeptide (TPR) repeat protein